MREWMHAWNAFVIFFYFFFRFSLQHWAICHHPCWNCLIWTSPSPPRVFAWHSSPTNASSLSHVLTFIARQFTSSSCYICVLHPTARRHRRRPGVLRAEVRRDPGCNSQACQRSAGRQAHLGACFLPGCRVQETQSGENFITLTCENRQWKISLKILFPLAGAQRQILSTVLRKTTTLLHRTQIWTKQAMKKMNCCNTCI